MKDKISKQAYFIKRMRDSGYHIRKVYDRYSQSDSRSWTVMVNAGTTSVFCTCCVNHGEKSGVHADSKYYFILSDGGQFIPNTIKLDTLSFEIVASYLIKVGIYPVFEKGTTIPRKDTQSQEKKEG